MKSQARILFCLTQGLWGGAQKYVLDLAAHLSESFDVHIAIGQDEAHTFLEKVKNTHASIQVHILHHLRREIQPIHDILAVFEMKKLYQKLQPDVIHLNSSKAGVIGSLARIKGPKIVYTAHGWVFLEPLGKLRQTLYRLLEKYTAPFKDTVIVLSPEEQTVAEHTLHIPIAKLVQIPLGIETISPLEPDEARKQLQTHDPKLDTEKFWFGTIANSYPTKGLDVLIESVSGLPEAIRAQAQWVLIGDGPEKPSLELLIKKLGLESSIFLLSFVPEAARFLTAFDTFVLPSRKEGLPYTLLEALQVGIPIIATKVGGVPSLIENEETGILVPPQDTAALTQAFALVLENKGLRQKMKEKEQQIAKRYTFEQLLDKTKSVYQK